MKIITINLPEYQILALQDLVSKFNLFPSRSEAIRVAISKFVIKERIESEIYTHLEGLRKKVDDKMDEVRVNR